MTESPEVRALQRWVAEPVTFVRQAFGAEPDPWQARELEQLPKHDRIALAGSKGCAKTTFLSWAIWYALTTQVDSKTAATSINGAQLRDGLWAEMAKWQARSPLLQALFHWSAERIVRKTSPATWFAAARTWNQAADPNTQAQALAGIHGERVLFVIDEAGGVPTALISTADAVLATKQPGHWAKVLIAGNTTSTAGALYLAMGKQRQLWHCVRVTSDPKDPHRTPRVSAKWAQEQIDANGRENPWVKINVFAEFPEQAIGKWLSLSDMEAAQARQAEESMLDPLVLGVDVGLATDACVIYPRRARLLYEPIVLRGKNTIVIAAEVVRLARELNARAVFIDAGGPGIGVCDAVQALGLQCVPVYFGGAADDPNRFLNKRVEMYSRFAEWTKSGGTIEACAELVQDVTEPSVSWNLKGQQIMEPKDDVKARLGRSPDWGDGAALTFAYPVARDYSPVADPYDPRQMEIAKAMQQLNRERNHDEFGFGG